MKNTCVIATKIGKLRLSSEDQTLTQLDFLTPVAALKKPADEFLRFVSQSIDAYFADPHFIFDIPLQLGGTAFQQRVWEGLRSIPAGSTLTYGDLAKKVGSHPRAIGQACRRNPIAIIVPCHRVVAASHMGGFLGGTDSWLPLKAQLLAHEGAR